MTVASNEKKTTPRPPNFLVMLLDDHGWGDVGCNDPTVTETPNIDRLAQGGMRFTDFHVGASVCTPSRAALLTGRLGLRTGVTLNYWITSRYGIPEGERILPTLLPDTYQSHMIGKWHLGHNALFHPTYRGFQSYYRLPYSTDMGCLDITPQSCKHPDPNRQGGSSSCPVLCREQLDASYVGVPLYDTKSPNCSQQVCDATITEQPVNEFTLHDQYVARVIELFTEQSKNMDQPFFIYIAWGHTHTPMPTRSSLRMRRSALDGTRYSAMPLQSSMPLLGKLWIH